jgi:hypothetical protein
MRRHSERDFRVADNDTWQAFQQAVGNETTKRMLLLQAAATNAVNEFATAASHQVVNDLADPVEAESDLGHHLLTEAIGLLTLLTPEGVATWVSYAVEAEVATLKAFTDAYHDKMKSELQVSAHDARAKARAVLDKAIEDIQKAHNAAILQAISAIGERPDADLVSLLEKYPALRSVDESRWHQTVAWACDMMVILDDWRYVHDRLWTILDEAFKAEMAKQKGKVHFWHEMGDYERLVWLLSEVEPKPALYGDVMVYLNAIGADAPWWSHYRDRYHQLDPNPSPSRDEVISTLNGQVIADDASLHGRWGV